MDKSEWVDLIFDRKERLEMGLKFSRKSLLLVFAGFVGCFYSSVELLRQIYFDLFCYEFSLDIFYILEIFLVSVGIIFSVVFPIWVLKNVEMGDSG